MNIQDRTDTLKKRRKIKNLEMLKETLEKKTGRTSNGRETLTTRSRSV